MIDSMIFNRKSMGRKSRTLFVICFLLMVGIVSASSAVAYELLGPSWPSPTTTFYVDIPGPGNIWNDSFENAMFNWGVGTVFNYVVSSSYEDPCDGPGNNRNGVGFEITNCDDAWGANTLAVASSWSIGDTFTHSDIIFNNTLSWSVYYEPWESGEYDGIGDFQRVALHELGHTLGLGHEDDGPASIMTSYVGDLTETQADDIAGVAAIYGPPASSDTDGDGIADDLDDCPNDADNDIDSDSVCGDVDNCPTASNNDQNDADNDGAGDVCDTCPNDADDDGDEDGLCGDVDNCEFVSNVDQLDDDDDGVGDVCDACLDDPDNDKDGDGLCAKEDPCPNDAEDDIDGDGICGDIDSCPNDAENDTDDDGICGGEDTCPNDADNDIDGDGICGDVDSCPGDSQNDIDGDGICGDLDNCPEVSNPGQEDSDGDWRGDVCDSTETPSGWITIDGNVNFGDVPACALVLANGKKMFSCSGDGSYDLTVPLDGNGEITLFSFVSGLAPFKQVLTPNQTVNYDISMTVDQGSPVFVVTRNLFSTNKDGWVKMSGTIEYEGEPVCALVLANGQHMFSCGDNNGLIDMEVPYDANGQVTLFVFASGFQPFKEVL